MQAVMDGCFFVTQIDKEADHFDEGNRKWKI